MKLDKRVIFYILFTVWFMLWVNFTMRDLYREKHFNDYKILIVKDIEGKRSYVYGEHFYEFLKFVKKKLPEQASYDFVGIKDFSLASRRAIYYLYPSLRRKNSDYILVYDRAYYRNTGYNLHAKLDEKRFILKREDSL